MIKIKREVAQRTHPGIPQCLKPRGDGEESVCASFAGVWLMGWGWGSRSAEHQGVSNQTCRPWRSFGCWMARLAQHLGTHCWWAPSTKFAPLWVYVSREKLQSEKPAVTSGAHSIRMVLPDSFSHASLWAINLSSYKNKSICILKHCSFKITMPYFSAS